MHFTRREILKLATLGAMSSMAGMHSSLATALGREKKAGTDEDRVFICNEDSNTLSIINPYTNTAEEAVNLTSFDEDGRPPFRFITGGVVPPTLPW